MAGVEIRSGRDDDSAGLIALIGAVFDEYENCILDVDGEMPELLAIDTYFRKERGRFWVAERDSVVVGCVGVTPASRPDGAELKKLYVSSSERKAGIGGKLVDLVEAEARARNARYIDLWSDTKFETAHRFYERRGYVRLPETRELHDKSDTVEYHYEKRLD